MLNGTSQSPVIAIDEIVPGSVQQVENTLIAISAVSGQVMQLARFKAKPQPAPGETVAGLAKRKPGRKPGSKMKAKASNPADSPTPPASQPEAVVQ